MGEVRRPSLGRAIALAWLVPLGCGTRDAAGVPSDADEAAPPDARTGCAWVEVDGVKGPLPLSNTLRLEGTIETACPGTYTVKVTLDGRDLAPIQIHDRILPPGQSFEAQIGADGRGRWRLISNLWCIDDTKALASGTHALEVVALREHEGIVTSEGRQAKTVSFSGATTGTGDLPWAPGAPSRGTDARNHSGRVSLREYTVSVVLGGAPRAFPYQVEVFDGYDPASPAPTVLTLTGWQPPGTHRTFANDTGLRTLFNTAKFLNVIPSGNTYDRSKDSLNCSNPPCMGAYGCLNVASEMRSQCEIREGKNWYTPVLAAVLKDFFGRYSVDPKRVYATGLSCGASYAYCLGINYPGHFAAIAPVDGNTDPIVSYPPYGPYLPLDRSREIPMFVVGAVAWPSWNRIFGADGRASKPWCMHSVVEKAGSVHQWYPGYNQRILDFFTAHTL